jgi:methyl-accepting chemotaxis protein
MTDAINSTETRSVTEAFQAPVKFRSLKRQLLGCFLTIALVTLGVAIVLMVELAGGLLRFGQPLPETAAVLDWGLCWRIALGAALIIAAAGGAFYLLNRLIVLPLEKAAAVAGRMAEGNLGVTIPTSAPNEIGRLGESINGLAVNFQEALILVWNQTENAIARIHRTTRRLTPERTTDVASEMMADLSSARQDLENMQMMVRSFDLYDVTINESDVLTAKDTAPGLN